MKKENLPLKYVEYPVYGPFIVFYKKKDPNSWYYCTCFYRAIENYFKYILTMKEEYNKNLEIIDYRMFPKVIHDSIPENASLEEILKQFKFKDGICHECNCQDPMGGNYTTVAQKTNFEKSHGWYVDKYKMETGLYFLRTKCFVELSSLHMVIPEDITEAIGRIEYLKNKYKSENISSSRYGDEESTKRVFNFYPLSKLEHFSNEENNETYRLFKRIDLYCENIVREKFSFDVRKKALPGKFVNQEVIKDIKNLLKKKEYENALKLYYDYLGDELFGEITPEIIYLKLNTKLKLLSRDILFFKPESSWSDLIKKNINEYSTYLDEEINEFIYSNKDISKFLNNSLFDKHITKYRGKLFKEYIYIFQAFTSLKNLNTDNIPEFKSFLGGKGLVILKDDIFGFIFYKAENKLREKHGIPKIGEGWIAETTLYNLVKEHFPEALHNSSPKWLKPQHLDIFIPEKKLAIEYQGEQHFRPVEYFGGEETYKNNLERDFRKKRKCEKNSIQLIYWNFDEPITEENLLIKLKKYLN